jgi:hypothetical protein
MKSNTFAAFCKTHKIDLTQFPELEAVMWTCYRKARAGVPMDSKIVSAEIQKEKRRQADALQAAESVPLAQLVMADIANSRKVIRS